MQTCYICGEITVYGKAFIRNYKWGDKNVSKMEEVKAYTCINCGEVVFEKEEAKRLQDLSKHY